uniref:VWFA domain-containing protein n=1 Tax=Neolamprologus brichardi TaxID=32507 RepID=A0A3Q4HY41_NEOBR
EQEERELFVFFLNSDILYFKVGRTFDHVFLFSASTIPACLAFNIKMTEPKKHEGDPGDFYGYKVLQYKSGDVVTAPLRLNGSGGIYQPHQNKCPSLVHECNENSYLNSICYELSDQLQKISSFKPAYQNCTKKTVDLVFLFDGSASMTEAEFNKNKDFIVEIMDSLKNTSIKFAAVQFSTTVHKVFDFNDYKAGHALNNLTNDKHLKGLTNTHGALEFIFDEIFDNKTAGASPDATKVLILITDGDPSDTDKKGIIKKYDEKNIIRLVIGIKKAELDKFRLIASEPKDKNAFKIENYDGLNRVLENFQKKIFVVEGDSKVARAGNLTDEMSQSGFSAVFNKDTLILGSVGTNSWRGSLQERRDKTEKTIQDQEMEMDSYMGQVVLFKQNSNNWIPAQRITGDQIGSYFGAELCLVDIDSDGDTDFLLVGAPTFYQLQEKKEGQIYIYTLTDELQLKRELTVIGPSMGRFGTTISSFADLNGDGLRDVAVGAPLEDDNRGAVYIYLGDRHRGIRSTFSQVRDGHGNHSNHEQQWKQDLTTADACLSNFKELSKNTPRSLTVSVRKLSKEPKASRSWPRGILLSNTMISVFLSFRIRELPASQFLTSRKHSRKLAKTYQDHQFIRNRSVCRQHNNYVQCCTSRRCLRGAYTVRRAGGRGQILEVPFEKQCRKNDTCIAELDVKFEFKTPTLLVTENNYFNVTIHLKNYGEDSYNTRLIMFYPPGLSFSMMTLMKSLRATPRICNDLEGVFNTTVCGLSLPVYGSRSSVSHTASRCTIHTKPLIEKSSFMPLGCKLFKRNIQNASLFFPDKLILPSL